MIVNTPILAQVEASASTGNTTNIILVGFLFVMVVLAVLAAITATIGALFSRQAAKSARQALALAQQKSETPEPATATEAKPVDSTSAETDASLDPHLLAVIAAAVHTVVGARPHRVISIVPRGPGWAQEGRRQIFSSHRTR